MAPTRLTDQQITEMFKTVLRVVANIAIENDTLKTVLVLYSPQAALAIPQTREVVQKRWQPILDNLAESTPESLVDILQNFEGPVQ